ncbi:hypothetical protein ASE69_19325 [Sphingomonas sp. Leaf208]|uniref:hypothetical protein n=1 Tax=Sphingomonas sp. Leaf208 TaxID=1735679 RepID=UPI0006F580CF|nr:hypothetical protein ASE69_19325 [Sphingomonas sp. Leaf208]
MIARCLAALHAELTPHVHNPEAIRLTEHVRLRDLAVAQAVQLGNQLETIADTAMRRISVESEACDRCIAALTACVVVALP